MRIAISKASSRWGGAGSMAALLTEGLTSRGHHVLLMCDAHSPLEAWARDRGVPYAPVLQHPDFPPIPVARCMRALRHHSIDVLLSSTERELRTSALAARLSGVPVITRRLAARRLNGGPVTRALWRRLPSHYVANSRVTMDALVGSGIARERVSLIYNGIDVERYASAPRAPLDVPADAVVIGWVGRFEADKSPFLMAAAWRSIAQRLPHAHMLIVGSGGLEREVRASLADVPRTHWFGFTRETPALMQALDVLLLTSQESFGMVLVEAMAAHTPVVAPAIGAAPEVVRDEIDGVLTPPNDPHALADAVVRLGADATLRQRMGACGQARARAEFSSSRTTAEYESLLERVLVRHRAFA